MPSILAALRAFNRKERFLLLQWVLDRPNFALGDSFRSKLEAACHLDLSGEAVVAMDYHLDWIYAALRWATEPTIQPGTPISHPDDSASPLLITGSQEDVDLLVATAGGRGVTNLIMVEAKAYSPNNPHQLMHKVARLRAIFGDEGSSFPTVVPRFAILGPKAPDPKVAEDWPAWMKKPDGEPYFVAIPPPEDRYKVHRDSAKSEWTTWKILPDPWLD